MKYIDKDGLLEWLEGIIGEYTVTAPVEREGVLLYNQVDSPELIAWHSSKPVNSVKEVLFPQTEVLVSMKMNGQGIDLMQEAIPQDKNLIFCARPCDVHGITILDAMFLDTSPEDIYYASRRRDLIIFGLACNQMGESCFCTSVGGGPSDSTGMDVMLTDVRDGFIVEAITPKGERILAEIHVSESDRRATELKRQAEVVIPDESILSKSFASKIWGEQAERCISCRICAFICPTCRCFDVRDELTPGGNGAKQTNRVRCWDSCTTEAYRKIAGGHNPRAHKSDRLRNRVMCKLHYFPQQYGVLSCVGCGRCIDSCPAGVDITETIGALVEEGS